MSHVYLDTNVFLDFYQASTDKLDVFRALVDRADKILLTDQTIAEFRRNRVGRLKQLVQAIRRAAPPIHVTAAVQALPAFAAWESGRAEARRAGDTLAAIVENWISDEAQDLVLAEFTRLTSAARTLTSDNASFERAQRRKAVGNPPTSPDKHTVGDELIWEVLLAHAPGDLVVVSRDKTFLENHELLRTEYEQDGRRKLLLVTGHLNKALSMLSVPSKTVGELESEIDEARSGGVMDPWRRKICPMCSEVMEEEGVIGPWRDRRYPEGWWLQCPRCGFVASFYPSSEPLG